ncbi:MAG: hypothetical protein U0Y96_02445 [Candidatus Kapaibacterium sp.]|nr:hypothetical protein [Bacteroidota bacterium]
MKTIFILLIILILNSASYAQCFISGTGSMGQLYKTTGNYVMDCKFNYSKTELEQTFGVLVDLYVYNDSYSPNALASYPMQYNYDGTVAFGYTLLTGTLWNANKGEYAVAGVMAHEFAHILQIKKHCTLTQTQKELQADYLAGYYFGTKSYLSYGLRNFATSLYELGDYNFWDPNHHGTPTERVNAMMAGYKMAGKSIDVAYREGVKYVSGINNNDDENEDAEEEDDDEYSFNKTDYGVDMCCLSVKKSSILTGHDNKPSCYYPVKDYYFIALRNSDLHKVMAFIYVCDEKYHKLSNQPLISTLT